MHISVMTPRPELILHENNYALTPKFPRSGRELSFRPLQGTTRFHEVQSSSSHLLVLVIVLFNGRDLAGYCLKCYSHHRNN